MRLPEQVLWSVTLSSPLATLMAVDGGLFLGNVGVGVLFLLFALVAGLLHLRAHRSPVPAGWLQSRPIRTLCIVVGAVSLYMLFAAAGLEVRGRILEGVASADWSVRVPLVESAIRTGMPLVNPFYAVNGQVGMLRYYMYWYALCGVIGKTFHLPARAVMQAGAAWAALLMFSTLFLLVKYLFRPAPEWPPMRWARVCVGCVCAMPILGLDFLQAIYSFAYVHLLMPEIEWWRARPGFAPSFHTFFLYAPHHTFGICAGFTGIMVLLMPRLTGVPESNCSGPRTLLLGAIAGLCFGSMAGTSTYISIFFAVACCLIAVDSAVRRDWWMLLSLTVSGIVGGAGAWHFIHLVLSNPATTGADGAFVAFHLRGWDATVDWYIFQFTHRHAIVPALWIQWVTLIVLYLLLEFAEAGVFLLVLVRRVRHDLLAQRRMSVEQRMQWLLVLAFTLCALFLTSEGTIGTNDLGYHAGFALRVVGVLWSAPWIALLLEQPGYRQRFFAKPLGRFAVAVALIGVATQAWQLLGQRFVLLTTSAFGRVNGPFPDPPHLAHKYELTYLAWHTIDDTLPADARILTNPDSPQRSMAILYANRQLVAPEPKCMAAFGGDPAACREAMPLLRQTFGNTAYGFRRLDSDTTADVATMTAACRTQHATAILVSNDDAVWYQRQSWVWKQVPVYDNLQERLYLCDKPGGAS